MTSNRESTTASIIYSTGIFLAFSAWFTIESRKQRRCDQSETHLYRSGESGRVGKRGIQALTPVRPYLKSFFLCLQNPCIPDANPEGHIALCVAENMLVQELFARRLMQPGTAITAFSDSIVYSYGGFLGLPSAREAFAYFLAHRFLLATTTDRGHNKSSIIPSLEYDQQVQDHQSSQTVNPAHVALGSGANSLLSHLFFTLAEKEDAVLIPAPYYTAFENDMKVVAGCVPFPVHSTNPVEGPTLDDLEAAAKSAEKKGLHVKILLLTNPNTPLGVYYRPPVVRDAILWARNRGMHTIVDELYALSVHQTNHEFQSVIQILNNQLNEDVHMIWALSKDFGACGFRVGVLYTQNDLLLQALANLNIFSGVPHPMQMITAEILLDDAFVDSFLGESRSHLLYSYGICARKLDEMVIPYIPAEAGLFVYADFSSILPSNTFEGEDKFAALVQEFARVVMTPGQSLRDRKPGMFRICYAWVSPAVLEIAMDRLSCLVAKIRKIDWDDLDARFLGDVVKFSHTHGLKRSKRLL